MATLHVVWDENDRGVIFPEECKKAGIRRAEIHLADDLDKLDIYEMSRKLAELLLEQLA